jgi:hypothetical protein
MYTVFNLDKARNLRYGMKAISLIEKTLNTNIMKLELDNLSITETAVMIWAGLVHEDKELTVDSVMDLIDDNSNLTEAMEIMAKALTSSFGDSKNGKKYPPK